MKITRVAAVAVSVAALALPLSAALTAYEYFDYPGQPNIIGQTGGSGWSTAWAANGGNYAIDAGYSDGWLTNSAYTFTPVGGFVKTDNTTYFPYRSFTTALNLSVDANYYFSFLCAAYESAQFNHLEFNGDTVLAGFRENGSGKLTGRAVCGSGTQNLNGTYELGENCFMIGKIEAHATGNDYMHLSIYTAGGSVPGTEPATYQLQTSGAELNSSLTGVTLKNGGTNGDGKPCNYDELRFGESWADVAIPEPAALGLAVVALGLLRRK